MSDGYSLFKSGGGCYCRWSEWHDGKRTQPSHRLGNVRDFPQKKELRRWPQSTYRPCEGHKLQRLAPAFENSLPACSSRLWRSG